MAAPPDEHDTRPQPYRWRDRDVPEVPVPLPRGWTMVPTSWVNRIIAYSGAFGIMLSQVYTWIDSREVSTELIALVFGLLGLPTVLRFDERRNHDRSS